MKIRSQFTSIERQKIVDESIDCLWSKHGQYALDYLAQNRKLSEDCIRKFSLGYIPNDFDHQLNGRIIIPIYDYSGNLICISSRSIHADTDFLPTYWHERYEKSFYLYGMNLSKDAMIKWRFAIVVEGQFDVMQLHNHNITNAVGLCGVNFSDIHLATIYRICDEVIFVLDSDPQNKHAGQSAMKKIDKNKHFIKLESGYQGSKFGFVELPGTTDPDDYIKTCGVNSFKNLVRDKVKYIRKNYVY